MTLFLYDIDGTLLNTRGAGREALNLAFESVHRVEKAFDAVNFGGATDQSILAQAYALAGLEPGPGDLEVVKARYLRELRERLAADPGRVRWCPGVERVVTETGACGTNALLTGNWEASAALKLGPFFGRFAFGAFGDDSPRRNDLVEVARRRAVAAGVEASRVVVIGDTPADIACARAGDAIAVAVCTGWSDRATLEAAGPDLLLSDLDTGREALVALC